MPAVEKTLQERRVVEHARERLVQLVRRGAGELGDDGLTLLREDLLLRLLEPLLHAHLLAKIGEDADAADGGLALEDERAGERDRDGRARARR